MRQVKVSDEVHAELTDLRDSGGHTSIDSAIRELINGFDETKPWRDAVLLRDLHHNEELSMTDIARRLDCTQQTVKRWLRRHDIEIRSHSHAPAGEDHPLHKGREQREYNGNDALRQDVKKRDDYECQVCGMTEEEHKERYGHRIHVHHMSDSDDRPDGPNATKSDLITLCANCHKKADIHGRGVEFLQD